MQEDKEARGPAVEPQEALVQDPTKQQKPLPPIAAYGLLFVTTASAVAAFWLALSQQGGTLVRPAATVVIAGLAGGRSAFPRGRHVLLVKRSGFWLCIPGH